MVTGRLAMSGPGTQPAWDEVSGTRPRWDEDEVRLVLASMEGFFDGDEPVDELAHALQSATHALSAGAGPDLLAAAFLHDVGRSPAVAPLFPGMPHERAGAGWLAPRTSEKVAWLVEAHVPAKVFLVESDPDYLATLSQESVISLRAQKSATDHADAGHGLDQWAANPWWSEALQLRRWDDAAKVPGAKTAGLEEIFEALRCFSTGN
jgi:predicted HD phosphohydrolase